MLQDIVSQYKGSFAPGASTELRAQRNLTRRVTLISGSLTSNQRTDAGGVGARAYRDGRLVSIGGGADEIMLGIIAKLEGTLPKKAR